METSIKGKVAFFMNSNYKFFSGGKYHALLLAAALAKQDVPVVVLTERQSPVLKEFEGMFEVITSERWEKEIDGDPDQFEFIVGVPFDAAERAKFFAKRFFKQSVLLVFDVPNWEYEMKTPGQPIPREVENLWRGMKFSALASSAIICSNKIGEGYARKYLTEGHPLTFYNIAPPLNTPTFEEVLKEDIKKKKQILYISRFVDHKNYKLPLQVAAEAKKAGHDYEVVMIGGFLNARSEKYLKGYAGKNNVRMKILPSPCDVEKFRELRASEILLFPSTFEGYGMPPAEAIYAQVPCLCFDMPVLRENYGADALNYAKYNDMNDYIKKGVGLLIGKEKANIHSGKDLKNFRERFSLDTVGKGLLRLFERINTHTPEQYAMEKFHFDLEEKFDPYADESKPKKKKKVEPKKQEKKEEEKKQEKKTAPKKQEKKEEVKKEEKKEAPKKQEKKEETKPETGKEKPEKKKEDDELDEFDKAIGEEGGEENRKEKIGKFFGNK